MNDNDEERKLPGERDGTRINEEALIAESQSPEEPIFILTYTLERVIYRVITYGLAIPIGMVMLDNSIHYSGFRFFISFFSGFFAIVFAVWIITDILLFKELRLYSNRVLKVWRNERKWELYYENASFGLQNNLLFKWGCFSPQSKKGVHLANCMMFFPTLSSPEILRKFYDALAKLTGRRCEEFANANVSLKHLLKERN